MTYQPVDVRRPRDLEGITRCVDLYRYLLQGVVAGQCVVTQERGSGARIERSLAHGWGLASYVRSTVRSRVQVE